MFFKNNLREIEEFVDTLPLAHPERAAQLLYDKMEDILSLSVNKDEKIKLLAALNSPVEQVYKVLKQSLLHAAPLTAMSKKDIIHWAIQLPIRYATVYASLINNASNNDEPAQTSAALIFHAMYFLLCALLVCYDVYMSIPTKLWLRLNTLYFIAEKLNVLNLAQNAHAPFSTIYQLYNTCLMLAMASPYQLRPSDIERLCTMSAKWADKVILSETKEDQDSLFVVLLDQDSPPIYRSLCTQTQSRFVRSIEPHAFIAAMQRILQQHSDEASLQNTALAKNVFEYIIRSWGGQAQRIKPREKKSGQVKLCFGIASLHYFISGEKTFNEENFLADINNVNKPAEKKETESLDDFLNITEGDSNKKNKFRLYDFSLVDEGSGGLCLATQALDIPMLQTNEVVGIQYPDTQYRQQWRIGLVRWFKQVGHDSIHVGIQLMAPNALTIAVCIYSARIKTPNLKDLYRALLLPEMLNAEQPSSIILPPRSFLQDCEVTVYHNQNKSQIVLAKPLLLNEHFCQYAYQTSEHAAQAPKVEFNKKVENIKFDNIWNDLLKG